MLNMTSDSHLFRTLGQLVGEGWQLEGNIFVRGDRCYLPLYEAKLFHQYDHRFATFHGVDERALSGGNAREITVDEKADPEAVVIPRYWVAEEEVIKRLDKQELGNTISDRQTLRVLANLARSSLSEISRTRPTSGRR